MTPLIHQFHNEHRTILTLLQKIKREKLSDSERKAYLLTVKSVIMNHLQAEEEKLYPRLKEMANEENRIMDTVNEFTVGLQQIGALITSFFNKNDEDLDSLPSSSDFSKILKLLEIRINKEEKGLYPIYDQYSHEA